MPFKIDIFKPCRELQYGFSEKSDGSMKWFSDKEQFKRNRESREKFFEKNGFTPKEAVTADLVHGAKVKLVDEKDCGNVIQETDALVTNSSRVFLTLTAADCFPVYLYDPVIQATGLLHAGWRGLVGEVAKNTLVAMQENFDSKPENILAGIGPGIRRCHFSIKPENERLYGEYPFVIKKREGDVFADLPKIIISQLKASRVREENIEDSELCTYCREDLYFSYRRKKPEFINAMIAYIGIS